MVKTPSLIKLKTSLKIRPEMLAMLLLSIANLIVYWHVKNFEFINLDDHYYVVENPIVQNGLTLGGLKWAFLPFDNSPADYWHPLTWLSLMMDRQLYGTDAGGYHWTNVLLHMTNTLLLFVALHRMTKTLWRSALVAVLFAVHPLHVESVAWISERKDVLCTLFWFLAINMYVRYVEDRGHKWYLLTFLCFLLGLLAKPMVVTLPFLLLLLDYWPLHRFQRTQVLQNSAFFHFSWPFLHLIHEKIPFFVLSLLSSTHTFLAMENAGIVQSLTDVPLMHRIANAFVAYCTYIVKMIWPYDLAAFYPLRDAWPLWQVSLALILVIFITAVVVFLSKNLPYLFTGWFWYLGTLVPVIGLVQVGKHSMADRYTYIPLTGLFIIIAWGAASIVRLRRSLWISLFVFFTCCIGAFMTVSWFQVQWWRNSLTLFQNTLAVTNKNYIIHNGLGVTLRNTGDLKGAEIHFQEALRIRPNFAEAHANLGSIYFLRKELDAAADHFREAIRHSPQNEYAHFNLGQVYLLRGRYPEAVAEYILALRIRPHDAEVHNYLGVALLCQNDIEGALAEFMTALSIQPNYAKAKSNLTSALEIKEHLKSGYKVSPSSLHP